MSHIVNLNVQCPYKQLSNKYNRLSYYYTILRVGRLLVQSSAVQDISGHRGEQRVKISRTSHVWYPSLRNNTTRVSVAVIIIRRYII